MQELIESHFDEHAAVVTAAAALAPRIAEAGALLGGTFAAGRRVYLCGNGGSAADAQHIAAELVGRFVGERRSLPAVALTTDTSALTAIANDYGYDQVFSRQVEGLVAAGDVLVAISTSGNSANVTAAAVTARDRGAMVIGLLGKTGGDLAPLCDVPLVVPSATTARIQECHILIGHMLCDLVEKELGLS